MQTIRLDKYYRDYRYLLLNNIEMKTNQLLKFDTFTFNTTLLSTAAI